MLFQKDIYDGYIKKIDRKKKEVNENKKERKRSLKKSVLQFPPISGDFLKPVFLHLFEILQACKPRGGDGTGAAVVFPGDGYDDLLYGYLSDPDTASPEIV